MGGIIIVAVLVISGIIWVKSSSRGEGEALAYDAARAQGITIQVNGDDTVTAVNKSGNCHIDAMLADGRIAYFDTGYLKTLTPTLIAEICGD